MIKAEPAEDYSSLKRQFYALLNLANSQEKMIGVQSERIRELESVDRSLSESLLESERKANAELTEDVERLSKANGVLQKRLRQMQCYCRTGRV